MYTLSTYTGNNRRLRLERRRSRYSDRRGQHRRRRHLDSHATHANRAALLPTVGVDPIPGTARP